MVAILDQNLEHLAQIIQRDLQVDVLKLVGGGAAGGLGAGLVAFSDARLQAGFDIVKEQTGLEKAVQQADIILTGEGKMDHQTKEGKTPWGVAQLALKHCKPCIGVAGSLGEGYDEDSDEGFTALFALPNGPLSLHESLAQAPQLLADTVEQIFRIIRMTQRG